MVAVDKHEQKCLTFITALQDCYRDEEDRELNMVGKLELSDEELTDDFYAMLQAFYVLYVHCTGDKNMDLLGFTHLLNRLVVQNEIEKGFGTLEDEKESESEG